MIIQSPTGTKSDSFRISKTEPNEIISPDGLNSGKRTLIKEEYELNSSLNKTKGDTSIINHSKSPETYLRPQSSSNLFKARESLKKLTLTSKLKPSSPEAQSQRTNLRIKTPKVIDGLGTEKSDVIIEGGSPRISSK